MSAIPPKADIAERCCHVRFVPEADISRCGKTAYSITLSALTMTESGTVTPSAFAVFEETKIKMYRCRNRCRMIGEIQLNIGRSGRI